MRYEEVIIENSLEVDWFYKIKSGGDQLLKGEALETKIEDFVVKITLRNCQVLINFLEMNNKKMRNTNSKKK